MPKSKRDKKISLTKTNKKGLEGKQKLIEDILECVDKYENIFLFSVQNMRNSKLKEIRSSWKDSRFFFGKNNVMKIGLSKTEIDQKLLEEMEGQCGLLFTTHSKDVVLDWFNDYSAKEFARSGFKANETVVLSQGPLPDFSHAIEPHLRKLGMPTKLDKGVVTLYSDYTVCEKGNVLSPEQAKILKLICRPIAEFKIHIESCCTKQNGFEILKKRANSKKTPMKAKDKKKNLKSKSKKSKESDDSEEEQSFMEVVENSEDDDSDKMTDDEDEDE